MILDKLPYTKGEKTAEIVCGAACGAILITELVLLILGKITSGAVVIIVASLVVYGILSGCSVYPQHTNVFTYPERQTEEKFHAARRALCWSRLILMAAMFAMAVADGFIV